MKDFQKDEWLIFDVLEMRMKILHGHREVVGQGRTKRMPCVVMF